jgi:F-type H+-transporting ATPase subunit epsilon
MSALTFELITPEGIKFHKEVYEVILPTVMGEIAVLPNHISLVTIGVSGTVSVRNKANDSDSELDHFATSGGFIEISGQHIKFLADTAEHADAIDELRAKQALEQARELKHTAEDDVSLADATRLIERNLARLKVAELKRRHHQQ